MNADLITHALERPRMKNSERRDPWNRAVQFYSDLQTYVGFDEAQSQALRSIKPTVEPHLEAVVDAFYEALFKNPHTRNVFDDDAQVERLRQTLDKWLRELFDGPHDHAYFERRWQIGRRHVAVGLLPHFMFGAMNVVRRELFDRIADDISAKEWGAIERVLDLDLMVMVQSYWDFLTSEKTKIPAALASGVAHEIRNPLNGISLNLTLLERTLTDSDKDRVSDILKTVRSEITRIQNLTTEMIDFARPTEIRPTWFSAQQFFSDFESFHRPGLEGCGISFEVQVDVDQIFGDRDRLRQVFVNLISNAADATNHDGGQILLRSVVDPGGVVIELQDNGSGMAQTQLFGAFDVFFTTKAAGTGLGLPIVKSIIDAHYGTIDIQSALNAGTTVRVFLPHPNEQL